jgi:hypothetical protein
MKKIILMFLFVLIFQFSLISAYGPVGENGITINITNGVLDIIGYTVIQNPATGLPIIFRNSNLLINETTSSTGLSISCNPINVPMIVNGVYNGTNTTVIPGYIFNQTYLADIPLTFQNIANKTNISELYCITMDKYDACINEKAKYAAANDLCNAMNQNISASVGNYNQCSSSLSSCQTERNTATTQVTTLTDDAEKKKNQKWLIGLVCLAAGYFGALWNKGFIGKPKVRNPDESYNRGQSA